ncbi:unnamed protein product [Phytophthora fragariaefolia]|uniref:Unnamed protein product n=1 Tax=Phytophthora fragariaefolia TaxID=1490495 RepID=A0A9W6WXH9_9STRA|nr:unnamed protein product [Phytophthora fragariaefolia]
MWPAPQLQLGATESTPLRAAAMDASLMANEAASSHAPLAAHEEEPAPLAADVQDGPETFDFHQCLTGARGLAVLVHDAARDVDHRRLHRCGVRGARGQRHRCGIGAVGRTARGDLLTSWCILHVADSKDTQASVSDGAFYFVIIVIGLYILVKLALIVRWIIYWIIIAELLTYAITDNLYVLFWIDADEVTDSDRQVRHVMIILLVSVEIITVFAYLFTHYAYPWLVLHQKFNLVKWWNIKPGVETNSITYRSKARFYTRKRNVIKYCGGLNAQGQPHGFGMWSDTAYHGERLTGQWEDGVPVGPFRSFEYGSGYSFVNIRIGFCHNRGEKGPTEIFFFPKHSDNGLNWGVASVECSVSGGFFKYLPTVTHLTPSYVNESPQSAAECLPALRTPTDGVVFNHKEEEEAVRHQPHRERVKRRHFFREESAPVLDLPSDADDGKEALVLLHGYNCSLDYGMNRLAQLLALGDFPSYIHPFVFSWPSGGVLAYFQGEHLIILMDGALFYLEYLSKKSVTGPLNYSLGRRGHMIHRDPEENDVAGRTDTQFLNWQNKNLSAPQDLDLAYAAVNQRGNYPGVASFAYNRSRTHPTGDESAPYGTTRGESTDEDAPLHYLDMDVIDTTWMDNNVHAIRHNYFNLNPTIVRVCLDALISLQPRNHILT